MKPSEQKALEVLEKAFTVGDKLELYVFEIQDYFANEPDQLGIDNPEMEDYLNKVIPEFTESYDNAKKNKWLRQLRKILYQAKIFAENTYLDETDYMEFMQNPDNFKPTKNNLNKQI